MVLNRNGRNNENGSFDWKDAIIDAAIMAGCSFFAVLVGLGAVGLLENPRIGLLAAGIAAGAQFCAVLAIKRGLREKE
jgi:hypothetical protein